MWLCSVLFVSHDVFHTMYLLNDDFLLNERLDVTHRKDELISEEISNSKSKTEKKI